MGVIERVLDTAFGGDRNVLRDTVEVFRENAEAGAARGVQIQTQALDQYGAEFAAPSKGGFDRFMDGLNRVPRPALALGTLGLFVSAMVAPLWFAQRMQGIALVPEPLWWLLGVIVSFYFGARHQTKSQDFQRSIVETVRQIGPVTDSIAMIGRLRAGSLGAADPGPDVRAAAQALKTDVNPALEDWRAGR